MEKRREKNIPSNGDFLVISKSICHFLVRRNNTHHTRQLQSHNINTDYKIDFFFDLLGGLHFARIFLNLHGKEADFFCYCKSSSWQADFS